MLTYTHIHIRSTEAYLYYMLTYKPKGSGELIYWLSMATKRLKCILKSFIASPVKQCSYQSDFSGVFDALH